MWPASAPPVHSFSVNLAAGIPEPVHELATTVDVDGPDHGGVGERLGTAQSREAVDGGKVFHGPS